jgi:hypothetical protein
MQLAQQQNDQLTSAITGGMQTGLQAQSLQNQTAAGIKSLANPNYINPYTQAAVAGPDYLGAYTTSNAADIARQNAAAARTANLQNGLFGLGNAALLGGGGVGGLLGLGSQAATGLSNLFNTPYNTSTNNFFTNPSAGGSFTGAGFQLPTSGISYDPSGAVLNSGISYPIDGGYTTSAGNFISDAGYSSLF